MSSKSRVDEIADDLLMCDESSHWDDRQILIEMAKALLEEARKMAKCSGCGIEYSVCQQRPDPCDFHWYIEGADLESLFTPTPQRTTEEG